MTLTTYQSGDIDVGGVLILDDNKRFISSWVSIPRYYTVIKGHSTVERGNSGLTTLRGLCNFRSVHCRSITSTLTSRPRILCEEHPLLSIQNGSKYSCTVVLFHVKSVHATNHCIVYEILCVFWFTIQDCSFSWQNGV